MVQRRRFSKEFKQSERQAFPDSGTQKPDDAAATGLRREVAQLKMERDILKTDRNPLCEGVGVMFGFIASTEGAGRLDYCARRSVS